MDILRAQLRSFIPSAASKTLAIPGYMIDLYERWVVYGGMSKQEMIERCCERIKMEEMEMLVWYRSQLRKIYRLGRHQ